VTELENAEERARYWEESCHQARRETAEAWREVHARRAERDALRGALEAIVAWWDEPLPGVPYLEGMVLRIAKARAALGWPVAKPVSPVPASQDDAE
jgi:hypothetical protein